jgi:crotonobetainyl-CoA:carnitine CoA-transferase CaiB-like acyl-CoA transferase
VNARELIAELDAIFATRTRSEWAEVFDQEPELFWTPVNTIDDLLGDEQFHASGAVVAVPDEEGHRMMLASPADFGGSAPAPRWRAPRLGEHTVAVLTELGHSAAAIDHLLDTGVAGPRPRAAGR